MSLLETSYLFNRGVHGGCIEPPSVTNGVLEATSRMRRGSPVVSSRCESVQAAANVEPPFPAYRLARDSGALAFWDEPEEDIYTFEDGEEV